VTGFLLDTNVISEAIKPVPNPRVTEFLHDRHDRLWLSVVVLYEMEYGVHLLPRGRRRLEVATLITGIVRNYADRILPLNREAALRAARLRARARRAGRPGQTADALIAGTAAANDLVVATRDTGDFAPFDIEVLNPWTGGSGVDVCDA
jgi:hypothetical protein